ncbi:hypothetical protein [Halorarius litoreus]|nr:hypothetical protein [Halorarius litoreus]
MPEDPLIGPTATPCPDGTSDGGLLGFVSVSWLFGFGLAALVVSRRD